MNSARVWVGVNALGVDRGDSRKPHADILPEMIGFAASKNWRRVRAFKRKRPMAKHRTHNIEFKRQVAQEFLGGETLHGLAKRHDICRNLIRVWVPKSEACVFDENAAAVDLLRNTKPVSRCWSGLSCK
jgi:hypothetical protein